MKIYGFMLFFIFFAVVSYTTIKVDNSFAQSTQLKSDMDIENFYLKEISSKGVLQSFAAKSGHKIGTRYFFNDFILRRKQNNFDESAQAQKGIYKPNQLQLEGNVTFRRHNDLVLKSQDLAYLLNRKIIKIKNNFIFEKNGSIAKGKQLVYNKNKGFLSAKNVHFSIRMAEFAQ